MSNLFERMAKSAGAGFAEKFNQNGDVEIYQFECEHKHVFFIRVELPKTSQDMIELLGVVQCPICYNKRISVQKTL